MTRTWLEPNGSGLSLTETSDNTEPTAWPLPSGSVGAVLRRYGKPVDEALVDLESPAGALSLGEGERLLRVRFRPHYDVIAKDYLVLEANGAEPVAELATTVTAALMHLGRAMARGNEE